MIIFRWNGTDLSQFTTITIAGTVTVSGGKIVLASSPGNHVKDVLGFFPARQYASTPGMSLEYDWEVNDLGPGDGFTPNHIILITSNSPDVGQPIPFPSWRAGLGLWYEFATDTTHWQTIRDQSHNPTTISPTALMINNQYRLKHSIDDNGVHTVSVKGDNFVTNLGPTTSGGGSYASITATGNVCQNNDFNNTSNPLTVVGAQTRYTNGYAFRDTCFHLNPIPGKYWLMDNSLNPIEQITVTNIVGNDVTFARGQSGTPITAFPDGRSIFATQELYIYFQNQTGSITSKFQNIHWTDNGLYNPPPPSSLTASMGTSPGDINLSWSNGLITSVNADYLSVLRSTISGGPYTEINQLSVGTHIYIDRTGNPGGGYFYRVSAIVSAFGTKYESTRSNEAAGFSMGTTGITPDQLQLAGILLKELYKQ